MGGPGWPCPRNASTRARRPWIRRPEAGDRARGDVAHGDEAEVDVVRRREEARLVERVEAGPRELDLDDALFDQVVIILSPSV